MRLVPIMRLVQSPFEEDMIHTLGILVSELGDPYGHGRGEHEWYSERCASEA